MFRGYLEDPWGLGGQRGLEGQRGPEDQRDQYYLEDPRDPRARQGQRDQHYLEDLARLGAPSDRRDLSDRWGLSRRWPRSQQPSHQKHRIDRQSLKPASGLPGKQSL